MEKQPTICRCSVDGNQKSGGNAPVEVGSLSHYLQGSSTIPGGCLGFLPPTVSPIIQESPTVGPTEQTRKNLLNLSI